MNRKYWLIRCVLLCLCMGPCMFTRAAQQPSDTLQVHNLIKAGDRFFEKNLLDSAGHYYLQAGSMAKKAGFKKGVLNYIQHHNKVLYRSGNFQEALTLSLEAIEISKELGNEHLATAYNNAGFMYSYLGNLEAAADSFLKALQLAEALNHPGRQQKYSNNLASIFGELGNTEKCYLYATKGYQLALQLKDTTGILNCLVNIGACDMLTGNYTNAAKNFHEVLRLGRMIGSIDNVLLAYINLAEVAVEQKNYPSALGYYQQGLQVLHYHPSPVDELYLYKGLATAYYQLQLYEKARHYLNKGIAISQSINNPTELQKLYELASQIYEQLQDPLLALDFRKKHEVLKDSLMNAQTQQNIHRMEIEYQTTQKEKEIAQQNLVIARNNLELERKSNLIYLSAAFLVTLLSGLLIFYVLYRNRQKSNAERMLAMERENELKVLMATIAGEEKERSRLARELHDGVGGIISAAKMHLSVLRNEKDLFPHLPKFDQAALLLDSASKEVRTIAHNLSPDFLLSHQLEEALSRFCKNVSNDYLQIDFYALGEPLRLKNNFKFIIYRIVQELVNNILKHAKASQALVQLSYHDQLLSLTIEDNGQGFQQQDMHGIGLLNLRSRVKELNGQLNIQSAPAQGTTIYLEFDVSAFLEKETILTSPQPI